MWAQLPGLTSNQVAALSSSCREKWELPLNEFISECSFDESFLKIIIDNIHNIKSWNIRLKFQVTKRKWQKSTDYNDNIVWEAMCFTFLCSVRRRGIQMLIRSHVYLYHIYVVLYCRIPEVYILLSHLWYMNNVHFKIFMFIILKGGETPWFFTCAENFSKSSQFFSGLPPFSICCYH